MSTWNTLADYGHRLSSTSDPPEQQSPLLTREDWEQEGIRLSDHEHAMPIQQPAASPQATTQVHHPPTDPIPVDSSGNARSKRTALRSQQGGGAQMAPT